MQCPRCGQQITIPSGWERRDYTPFGAGVVAVEAGTEYERRRPARDASLESDVAVPASQSAITAVILGCGAGAVAAVTGAPEPFLIGIALGAGAGAIAWLGLLADHRRLLWEIETATGIDLDGDGDVGEPEPKTRLEIIERQGNHTRVSWVDLPLDEEQKTRLAMALLIQKRRFSRRDLSDIIDEEHYSDVLQIMLDAGLVTPRGESLNAGVELSSSGRAYLKRHLPHSEQW